MCEDDRCELGKRKGAVEMNHDGNDGWRTEIWGPVPMYQERMACVNARNIRDEQLFAAGFATLDPRVVEARHRHREGQRIYMITPHKYGDDHVSPNARAIAASLAAAQVKTGS